MDNSTDKPKPDELLIELTRKLAAAKAVEDFELCAQLQRQIEARTIELDNRERLLEVTTDELLLELQRRTIAGIVAVQTVNGANRIETRRMNYGDVAALSGLRNFVMWDAGHNIVRKVQAMKQNLYPGWDDEGPHHGMFL